MKETFAPCTTTSPEVRTTVLTAQDDPSSGHSASDSSSSSKQTDKSLTLKKLSDSLDMLWRLSKGLQENAPLFARIIDIWMAIDCIMEAARCAETQLEDSMAYEAAQNSLQEACVTLAKLQEDIRDSEANSFWFYALNKHQDHVYYFLSLLSVFLPPLRAVPATFKLGATAVSFFRKKQSETTHHLLEEIQQVLEESASIKSQLDNKQLFTQLGEKQQHQQKEMMQVISTNFQTLQIAMAHQSTPLIQIQINLAFSFSNTSYFFSPSLFLNWLFLPFNQSAKGTLSAEQKDRTSRWVLTECGEWMVVTSTSPKKDENFCHLHWPSPIKPFKKGGWYGTLYGKGHASISANTDAPRYRHGKGHASISANTDATQVSPEAGTQNNELSENPRVSGESFGVPGQLPAMMWSRPGSEECHSLPVRNESMKDFNP